MDIYSNDVCRADKYTCPQLDSLSRDFLRRNFEKVVQYDRLPPNRVGLTSLSQSALVQILTDDNLELNSEVHAVCCMTCGRMLNMLYTQWMLQSHTVYSTNAPYII